MFGATDLEMEILRLLTSGRRLYGLEMVKESEKLKRGTIYVYLGRMEDKEWVKSEAEKEASVPGLPRRRYWITGKGQRVFDRANEIRRQFNALSEGLAV
ncbi:PadR family transcriptional regulator [Agrobacterium tumefaciens]|uniref:PadR family transcriptional regulator n=1 Tax=Agrobacterium tumefaciens TaxID=358 RepID=UPI00045A2ECF|nr:PadR family transcriptional regulator [Agrobacterium tumefaciens]UXS31340.1 PadR family transcriptional regulator [Agrobacterium tumefaciens]CDN91366.1 Putative transcriptional regulator [Agrobacterium tumefaciens]